MTANSINPKPDHGLWKGTLAIAITVAVIGFAGSASPPAPFPWNALFMLFAFLFFAGRLSRGDSIYLRFIDRAMLALCDEGKRCDPFAWRTTISELLLMAQALSMVLVAAFVADAGKFQAAYTVAMLMNILWLSYQGYQNDRLIGRAIRRSQSDLTCQIRRWNRTISVWMMNNIVFCMIGVCLFQAIGDLKTRFVAFVILALGNSIVDVALTHRSYFSTRFRSDRGDSTPLA